MTDLPLPQVEPASRRTVCDPDPMTSVASAAGASPDARITAADGALSHHPLPGQLHRRTFLRGAASAVPAAVSPSMFGAPDTRTAAPDAEAAPASGLDLIRDVLLRLRVPSVGLEGRTMADEERKRRRDLYRLIGFDAADFITAGELVGRLSGMIDRDRCAPWQLGCLERDLAHAMQADHVRYHREAFDILLARVTRHHHAGTHWFGKYYGETPSWDDLVLAAIFDLKNFHGLLRGCDEVIAYERDPLTFDSQVQVSIGGCILRYDEEMGVIGHRLCGWLRDTSVGSEDLVLERVRNVVWFLPIEL